MTFSERYSYKSVKEQIQLEGMDDRLRNALWNLYFVFINDKLLYGRLNMIYFERIWSNYLNKPIDEILYNTGSVDDVIFKRKIKNWFFSESTKWYEIYDFIEYNLFYDKNGKYKYDLNLCLENEMTGYRVINNKISKITSTEELSSIEESIGLTKNIYKGVFMHIQSALALLSNRENPDYRNSIKESISAVESLCKTLIGNDKAKLSHALELLKKQHNSHPALLEAFKKLYGYTSDGDGIRHAIMDDGNNIDFHDAKYMLVTCSAFINLMIGKVG